ncbi:MAG: lysophospholipid acyltransferase family protein [candidate division Zixibacteria bacterium]|nr:lysophospholipid acyltransferase family protein [candidate division Zixibacteria bacterium]
MANTFTLKQKLMLFFAGFLGYLLINLLGLTWKVKLAGYTDMNPQNNTDKKRIYCFWHNHILGLAYTQQKNNVGILISSHFDGEIIARIVACMGYHPIRGSSTKGGAAGLVSMLKNKDVRYLAFTADGPRGPKGIFKPGSIYLASKTGLPIVPITCNSSKKWVLSSWDKFEIPKPFAKVVVCFGAPIQIGEISGHKQIKEQANQLAKALNEIENCL